MAGTLVLAQFGDGQVSMEVDYNDSLDLLTFRCRNDSDQAAFGRVIRLNKSGEDWVDSGRQYGATFPAHQTTTIAIPTGVSARIRLAARAGGIRPFDGLRTEFIWPF